jgi:IS30 family transposase
MGRGKKLTCCEKKTILKLRENNKTMRQIGSILGRSANVVCRFLQEPDNYGTRYKNQSKQKVYSRVKRIIFNAASNKTISLAKIVSENQLNIHKMTVLRVINESSHLILKKRRDLQSYQRQIQ